MWKRSIYFRHRFGRSIIVWEVPQKDELNPPGLRCVLVKCNNSKNPDACGLVHLKHSVPPLEMYTCGYGYVPVSTGRCAITLLTLPVKSEQIVCLEKNDVVLDIGSNDGTLVKSYSRNDIQRIGMDPGGEQYKKYYPDNILLVSDFFTSQL